MDLFLIKNTIFSCEHISVVVIIIINIIIIIIIIITIIFIKYTVYQQVHGPNGKYLCSINKLSFPYFFILNFLL